MKKAKKISQSDWAEAVSEIKINKNIKGVNPNSPAVRRKMEKAEQMIAEAGLPKDE